ncbi:hypothetical protein GCM10023317_40460 [Actinopolymorpha pittospori]
MQDQPLDTLGTGNGVLGREISAEGDPKQTDPRHVQVYAQLLEVLDQQRHRVGPVNRPIGAARATLLVVDDVDEGFDGRSCQAFEVIDRSSRAAMDHNKRDGPAPVPIPRPAHPVPDPVDQDVRLTSHGSESRAAEPKGAGPLLAAVAQTGRATAAEP